MLHLNLISSELKKEIRLKRVYEVLKHINLIVVVVTILIAIVILVAKIILQDNFNKIVEQTTLITKGSQGRNIEIRDINLRLNYIKKVQDSFVEWSYLLEDMSKYANNGIIFDVIDIDKKDEVIVLSGIAFQRNDLILLKEGLKESEIFFDVDFPLKNILKKSDVRFNINAKLNLDKIGK